MLLNDEWNNSTEAALMIKRIESPLKTPFSRNGPQDGFFPGFQGFDVVEKYFH
jgi:hypothetical protein